MTKRNRQARTPSVAASTLDRRFAPYMRLWLSGFAVIFGYFIIRYVVLKLPVIGTQTVGPLRFNTFGLLMAMGILFGIYLTGRWCRHFGLDWSLLQEGVGWALVCGLVLAHLMAIGESSPANLLNPKKLLSIGSGISSFGGFIGGTAAILWFCKQHALPVRPYADGLLYGFIGGWMFGRLGCFSVHDHPGLLTTWPTAVLIRGELRHDLGFYELLFTVVLFAYLTVTLRKAKRFDGFVVAVTATSYPLVRFFLDFLRLNDPTYAGLTLAQWGCILLLAIGAHALLRGWRR